ncbi:unnamed protein product, partial [Aureobasidium vineae]
PAGIYDYVSRSPSLDSERSISKPVESRSDLYPNMLADLCSDSLWDLFETLRSRRASKPNLVTLETLVTMGVLQKGFEQWHALLDKAGTANLPGLAQDESDPFKISMMLNLIEICAHLEEAEFYLDGPDTTSKWQHAHDALDYCRSLGVKSDDRWHSEDEKEEEEADLKVRSTTTLQPLASSLTDYGFPVASDEKSFDTSLKGILRSFSTLESLVPGLELRLYMSNFGLDTSSRNHGPAST